MLSVILSFSFPFSNYISLGCRGLSRTTHLHLSCIHPFGIYIILPYRKIPNCQHRQILGLFCKQSGI